MTGELVGTAGRWVLWTHIAAIVLILAAVAVLLLVALPALGNARAIRTLVFAGCALRWLLLAILLVTPVAAIIVAVAAKAIQYTLAAGSTGPAETTTALELTLRAAIDHGRALQLVRIVIAVAFAVTAKGQGNAVAIVAGEMLIGAAAAIAVHLVRKILAIVFTIA